MTALGSFTGGHITLDSESQFTNGTIVFTGEVQTSTLVVTAENITVLGNVNATTVNLTSATVDIRGNVTSLFFVTFYANIPYRNH